MSHRRSGKRSHKKVHHGKKTMKYSLGGYRR